MKERNPMRESIVSSRNILLEGRTTNEANECLDMALKEMESIGLMCTREILMYCIAEAIALIVAGNYIAAGYVLNLVHNLPFDIEEMRDWNVDYFLSVELPAFLEHFDEIQPARNIVLHTLFHLTRDLLAPSRALSEGFVGFSNQ